MTLRSHRRPVVKQVAEPSADESSATGYLLGEESERGGDSQWPQSAAG